MLFPAQSIGGCSLLHDKGRGGEGAIQFGDRARVHIKGYEAGKDIAAAFDEVLAATPAPAEVAATPRRSDRPTVASLRVWADPEVAKPGGVVELTLEYVVQTHGNKVEAVETDKKLGHPNLIPTLQKLALSWSEKTCLGSQLLPLTDRSVESRPAK